MVIQEGFQNQHTVNSIVGLLVMGGVYTLGAMFYISRFPERFFPGKFNTWASSHQLFHVCVVCAALIHYNTLLGMIKYHTSTEDSCAFLEHIPTATVAV